jgi:phosphopentomutase
MDMRALLIVLEPARHGGNNDAWNPFSLFAVDAAQTADVPFPGFFGLLQKKSPGADSMSMHWELAGSIAEQPFAQFGEFPAELVAAIEKEAGVEFLGNRPECSFAIPDDLAAEHLKTGKLILQSSPNSIMQIAAHEEVIPRARLYSICRIARKHCDAFRISRVIARPLKGISGAWIESGGRHDYAMTASRTVLNMISEAGLQVEGVGKVGEIFGRSGITHSHPAATHEAAFEVIDGLWEKTHDGLIIATLAGLDDAVGEEFHGWFSNFLRSVEPEDLVIVIACPGKLAGAQVHSTGTSELPFFVKYGEDTGLLGTRESCCDVAATLADFFDLREKPAQGKPLLPIERRNEYRFKGRAIV